MRRGFRPNPRLAEQLKATPEYQAAMAATAQRVAGMARDSAPHQTGRYAGSVTTQDNVVGSTDPFAHLVEFGSANNPPYAPLRRAVRAAGLRLDEQDAA